MSLGVGAAGAAFSTRILLRDDLGLAEYHYAPPETDLAIDAIDLEGHDLVLEHAGLVARYEQIRMQWSQGVKFAGRTAARACSV